jgi:rubrerythrin
VEKWVCTVCGYMHVGQEPPERCPQCMAPREKFNQIDDKDNPWADQHEVGIAAGADEALKAGLKEHFQGECTEVGMYLAMARQADREGFPEIAAAFQRIAWEEAGHAALFGEMLGEVLEPDTRLNLKLRTTAEHGACAGKVDLADMAEKQGLPAVRDAVREMARDEARHGSVFQGLLRRYFKSS